MKAAKRLFISFIAALFLGAAVSLLSPGTFLIGWLAASFLSWISIYFMLAAWEWGGGGKTLAWMMVLAFFIRLGIGVALNKGLPVYGYPEEAQYHGYVFRDAHERDIAAWNLAQSDRPLWVSFQSEIAVDQYGGLLSMSAAVYRFLSPDAHRPYLILILGAFVTALGIPFFRTGLEKRWNKRLANLASWIIVFYPDGVLFGSSQMREPYLLGFSMIAFWAVLSWPQNKKTSLLAFSGSTFGMLLISSRIAIAIVGFLGVWFLIEQVLPRYRGPKWVLWGGMLIITVVIVGGSIGWFLTSARLDFILTEMSSGWVQKIIEEAGEVFRIPIITTYGLVQPVLPATIVEPTLWIWRAIMVPRALGWYILAPVLIYSLFAIARVERGRDKNLLIWLLGFIFLWLILSSARAGGDAWDNPRYRAAFLPWMALLAAWAVHWAIAHRDAWLIRCILIEIIFLVFFTNWYISRYTAWWEKMPFWNMIIWIFALSMLVLTSGWLWKIGQWLIAMFRK